MGFLEVISLKTMNYLLEQGTESSRYSLESM